MSHKKLTIFAVLYSPRFRQLNGMDQIQFRFAHKNLFLHILMGFWKLNKMQIFFLSFGAILIRDLSNSNNFWSIFRIKTVKLFEYFFYSCTLISVKLFRKIHRNSYQQKKTNRLAIISSTYFDVLDLYAMISKFQSRQMLCKTAKLQINIKIPKDFKL